MKKPIVLLDCDGVLAQTPKAVVELINRSLKTTYHVDDIKDHEIFRSFGIMDQKNEIWNFDVEFNNFCAKIEPFPEALSAVEQLQTFCDVYCVTAPFNQSPWMHERLKWLQDVFNIDKKHVVQTDAKHIIYGDLFVDDLNENIDAWKYRWPHKNAVLFKSSYTIQSIFEDVIVTNDWQKIIKIAESL